MYELKGVKELNQFISDYNDSFCDEFFSGIGLKEIDSVYFSDNISIVTFDFNHCNLELLTMDILDWANTLYNELLIGESENEKK